MINWIINIGKKKNKVENFEISPDILGIVPGVLSSVITEETKDKRLCIGRHK